MVSFFLQVDEHKVGEGEQACERVLTEKERRCGGRGVEEARGRLDRLSHVLVLQMPKIGDSGGVNGETGSGESQESTPV